MTEIIKIKDNIIIEHSFVNRELRDGEIEVKDFNGNVGDDTSLYDENWNIIPETKAITETVAAAEAAAAAAAAAAAQEAEASEECVKDEKQEEQQTFPSYSFTKTDELTIQLQEIDRTSIRSIRAILSGTDTEEDHKTLKALEKQAINLRKELNTTTVNTNVVTNVDTNK